LATYNIRVVVNENRLKKIAEIIRDIGLKTVYVIEDNDPQLKALKVIYEKTGHIGYACLLAVANALISYKLAVKGEKYWTEFSKYMARTSPEYKRVFENIKEFLVKTKLNVFALNSKVSRLGKFLKSPIAAEIYTRPQLYKRDLEKLRHSIAKAISADPDAKTIVFSVKMFYYAYYSSTGERPMVPYTIPLPVDIRIATLTISSGIMDVLGVERLRNKALYLLGRKTNNIRKVWFEVSSLSGIPSLNIDSLLWPIGVFITKNIPQNILIHKTLEYMKDMVKNGRVHVVENLILELLKYH